MTDKSYSRLAVLGFAVGGGALLMTIIAGLGTRGDIWTYRIGFTILRWSAWTGLAGAAIALVGCFAASRSFRRGLGLAALGLIAGTLAYSVPAAGLKKARSVPRIHDITTDTQNPPTFVDAVELRRKAGARNTIEYAGERIARLQRKAYPDVRPVMSKLPPERLFERAVEAARTLGWHLTAGDKAAGRIEATDSTFWFGFTDDIVIRISPAAGGSRLDIRSVSRVGRSDAGTNAARIRRFIAAIR